MARRAVAAVGAVSLLWFLAPLARAQQPPPARFAGTIRVPADVATIQAAVDRVEPGGMVLIAPGVYDEQITVTTPYFTIRGEDRNETIIDASERATAIEVDGANGVVIQNLSVRNASFDGIAWNGVDGFWGSSVTAYDNGRYGIVSTSSTHGQVDHAYTSGNAEAGIATVGCNPCASVISDVSGAGSFSGASGASSSTAGMADVAGHSRRPDPVRVGQLVAEARAAFPGATDYAVPVASLQPWTGLRPATPKGSPLLGRTPVDGLFVNCGQGALGWTLALASGRVVADDLAGRRPEISLEQFAVSG